jgi:hypothetical protein
MNKCGILTAFCSAALLFVSCSPEQDQLPPGDSEILEITEADIGFRVEEGLTDEQARAVLEKEAKGLRAALV